MIAGIILNVLYVIILRICYYSYVGQGMIDAPLSQVAEFVKDIESSYIWEKFLVVCILCMHLIML